jgi:anti-sigma-K factor RskA
MNPCQNNRKEIALLATNALEVQRQQELRAHLDKCAGCRGYFEQMSNVVGKLRPAESAGAEPSEMFHRDLVRALAREQQASGGEGLWPAIWSFLNWRWALPAAAVVALVLTLWFAKMPGAKMTKSPSQVVRQVAAPHAKPDLEPTFSNYEIAVHQSLDKLDELLMEQGNRSPTPSPIYTAGTLPRSNMAD